MGMEYFGDKLKIIRQAKGLTQKQLADKLGISKGTISAYEQSTKHPSLDVLINICNLFKVSSDYMLGLSDDMSFKMAALTDEQTNIISKLIIELQNYNEIKDTTNL